MSRLFEVLAGTSSDHFTIGGIEFQAAPLTLQEYGEYLALPDGMLDAKAEFLAERLRRRVRGTRHDPVTVTPEWVMGNVPLPTLQTVEYVLLYGRMPEAGDEKKAR